MVALITKVSWVLTKCIAFHTIITSFIFMISNRNILVFKLKSLPELCSVYAYNTKLIEYLDQT